MSNKMKIFIIFLMVALIQIPLEYSSSYDELLESSVGKLLLLHDKKHSDQVDLNSFGSAEVYKEFLEIYNREIKSLPKDYRINYFWVPWGNNPSSIPARNTRGNSSPFALCNVIICTQSSLTLP